MVDVPVQWVLSIYQVNHGCTGGERDHAEIISELFSLVVRGKHHYRASALRSIVSAQFKRTQLPLISGSPYVNVSITQSLLKPGCDL